MLPREVIRCPHHTCETSYTISYTADGNYTRGTEMNVDKMRRTATDILRYDYPTHSTRTHLWKGPERCWLEADSLAARAAL